MSTKLSIFIYAILFISFIQFSHAQTLTQRVKGTIIDEETNAPLEGATVFLLGTEKPEGASSDSEGNFLLENVPLGRQSFRISYVGYETRLITEIMVTSGKELVLDIGLQPNTQLMNEVVVSAIVNKNNPLNNLALSSARAFTVEETRRYAGGLDDPARLVSAFAGVATGNISDNAIIVRGNSPKGIAWMVEGVEIPSPHHFEGGNIAGGGIVTLFSSQLLANSDFFTGAFPAEYENALAGVFDMKFRTGNADTREHTAQVGLMGIDVASEGPFSKNSNAFYLFNYRYSTFGLLTDLKLINVKERFKYQDLSFKLNFPTKHAGTFSLWGIGGIDNSSQPIEKDSTKWELDWDRVSYVWDAYKGGVGLTHKKALNSTTYLHTTIAGVGNSKAMDFRQIDNYFTIHPELLLKDNTGTFSLSSTINHRFNKQIFLRAGAKAKYLMYNLFVSSAINYQPETYQNFVDERGRTQAYSFFAQSKIDISARTKMSGGVNLIYFALNKSTSLEPRIAFTQHIDLNHTLSLSYGLHSQSEELKLYLMKNAENDTQIYPNTNLKPTKAHHLVMTYDWQIQKNLRLKIEPYYQYLFDALGTTTGTKSMLNHKNEWFFKDKFENNVVGKNLGVEITFERFLANNYYYLFTGSIFDSKYKTHDNRWRNTRYNKNFVFNALGGKEFFFKNNERVLGVNARVSIVGGERFSPVLEKESIENKRIIYDESRAFEKQLPTSINADVSITYRMNRKKYSSVIALQVKNILGTPTYQDYDYNHKTNQIQQTKTSGGMLPSLSYKIEF